MKSITARAGAGVHAARPAVARLVEVGREAAAREAEAACRA